MCNLMVVSSIVSVKMNSVLCMGRWLMNICVNVDVLSFCFLL